MRGLQAHDYLAVFGFFFILFSVVTVAVAFAHKEHNTYDAIIQRSKRQRERLQASHELTRKEK